MAKRRKEAINSH